MQSFVRKLSAIYSRKSVCISKKGFIMKKHHNTTNRLSFIIVLSLVLGSFLASAPMARAYTILGTGNGALLGNDLTDQDDVHNEGVYAPPGNMGGFDATFTSDDEPGFGGGEFSFNCFDNGTGGGGDKWCCNDPSPGGGDGFNLTAEFASQYILTHFTITSSNDSQPRDPRIWNILGSNDGVVFTPIFSYNELTAPWTQRRQVIRFDGGGADFATPPPYTYIRYQALESGNTTQHALGEIEYFGTEFVGTPPTLMYIEGGLMLLGLALLGYHLARRSK
jgi:hypothetical protein